ncbi:hypothetical protein BCU30_005590 [Vibrio lentus]|uniref:hypothetical protein n=1 Tax=Vibrio lentus TaxID=136468 RepID=UPI0007EE9C9A|nr:hypothetical protein [Vibrio lentus]OBT27855.1 hypothetical protein A9266_04100 [Vibrio tasmaniensis]PMG22560.1 hypothetical protein BCU96_17375 [Vibrio lentus]PMH14951.1 hypothetical protein BCU76_15345 [Vibrio lentus]PMJ09707.1 hypothetical protein BCU30_23430 [Vibrio lentus]PMK92228.1 hypothetical protein BCT89_21705 [Vibrio lentus]
MTLLHWSQQLSDDFLVNWTNRGLLRRATKQSQDVDISEWDITPSHLNGVIDQHQLTLSEKSVDALTCSCGAINTCFHKVAFFIALRQCESQATPETTTEVTSSLAPFSLNEWFIQHCDDLAPIMGKSTVTKAIQHWRKGITLDVETHDEHAIVQCHFASSKSFRLYFPRASQWELATCSCKQHPCVHQAAALIALSIQGNSLAMDEAIFIEQISDKQRAQLQQLEQWLEETLSVGVQNIVPAQLAQAHTLVLELNQVDLPSLSAQLNSVLNTIEYLVANYIDVDYATVIPQITALSLQLHALQQTPLPCPLYLLAGEHKRRYHPVSYHNLMGISVEFWRTDKGAQGYRFYLYDHVQHQWTTITDGRKAQRNQGWNSQLAFAHTRCDLKALPSLALMSFSAQSKITHHNELSIKDTKITSSPTDIEWETLFDHPELQVRAQWQRMQTRRLSNRFASNTDQLGWLCCEQAYQTQHMPYCHYQEAEIVTTCDTRVKVRIPPNIDLSMSNEHQQLLFGRWNCNAKQSYFEVLAMFTKIPLSDEKFGLVQIKTKDKN